jgi:hypothetical protein
LGEGIWKLARYPPVTYEKGENFPFLYTSLRYQLILCLQYNNPSIQKTSFIAFSYGMVSLYNTRAAPDCQGWIMPSSGKEVGKSEDEREGT